MRHLMAEGDGPIECKPNRYRKFWYAVLAMVLFVPFVLREISPQLEVYPAVLFPKGAFIAQVGDSVVRFTDIEVFAVTADGSDHSTTESSSRAG